MFPEGSGYVPRCYADCLVGKDTKDWIDTMKSSHQERNSHCENKIIFKLSDVHNDNFTILGYGKLFITAIMYHYE